MINFPILKELTVENYGLYPGTEQKPGLTINFRSQGLSVVLGANGLGKTTLINMIFRALTGAFDLGRFDKTDELGNLKLSAIERADFKGLFAARVQDQAKEATVTLIVEFDGIEILIKRSLHDLSLLDLREGLSLVQLPEKNGPREQKFQSVICLAAKVADFGDWLLILHYVAFYQEDRRALVWDTSAQRELLRILLLDAEESKVWKRNARKVLELDSEYRNLRNSLNKQIKKLRNEISSIEDRNGLRSQLGSLKRIREGTQKKLSDINNDIREKNDYRSLLREQLLREKNELDSLSRDLENAKLTALESTLPTLSDTSKFILTQLMAEGLCLACDSKSPEAKLEYERRLDNNICLICGTHSNSDSNHSEPIAIANLRIQRLALDIKEKELGVQNSSANLHMLEDELKSWLMQAQNYQEEIRDISMKIAPIEGVLAKTDEPATRAEIQIQHLESMRDDNAQELQSEHLAFRDFLKSVEHKFLANTENIQKEFNRVVQEFLIEDCEVSWKRVNWRLGQEGQPIEFPAFIFKMRSGNHQVVTERRDPTEVSESQREFIDLAFRMALIRTAGHGGVGSIIMDAPESSLDAVFVERAAHVFKAFSKTPGNKLMLASNLVDGNLLPTLISEIYRRNTIDSALINLFEVGTPSKAITDHKEQYELHLERVMNIAREIAAHA